jgi:hypothetical protein
MTPTIDMEMTVPARQKPGWSFYVIWVSLTTLCIPIGYVMSFIPLSIIIRFIGDYIYVNDVQHITEDYLGLYVIIPMIGLLTGLVQYGLLRPYLPRIGGWVLLTATGWLIGLLLIAISYWLKWIDPTRYFDVVFFLMGLSIGVAQWLLLRQRLPRAGWWIAANLAGWGLVALITTGNTIGSYGLLILGLFPACVTAGMLALLLQATETAN